MFIDNLVRVVDKLNKNRYIDLITGCWIYTGSITEYEYGSVGFNGKQIPVHRLSAALFLGLDLNSYLHSCHICDNKSCFNFNHLFIATPTAHIKYDTMMRDYRKGLLVESPKIPSLPDLSLDSISSYLIM